ncbi:MAG: HAMP domain-containing histidine kinase [Magnetococcales bacterium]|nr:HAMP domain-containing histidine kinase [Magnetococcales bacterium]
MFQTSLRRKVMLGYALISALALGLSLFTIVELRLLSQRLLSGEQRIMLLNDVLEMRRFEKNFFLYHQAEDREQLLDYILRVKQDLDQETGQDPATRATIGQAQRWIVAYDQLARHPADRADRAVDQDAIRVLGKSLVTTAEGLSESGRVEVRHALERHRLLLLAAMVVVIAVIVILGGTVSQRIVLPLRRIEESMMGVVNGQFHQIHIPSLDQEIVSLTSAFNRVLQELRQRQRHLLRSEKLASLGTLLSGVAHELNNPLSNISTSCQILAEELDNPDPAFQRDLVSQIDEQTKRARDIVRSLLDLARDRAFQRGPVRLAETVEEAFRFSKGHIPARIRVIRDIPADIWIPGDRRRLHQAFINLIKNAIDAIPETGEVRIRARRRDEPDPQPESGPFAGCRCQTPWCDIEVVDTGSGIDEAHIGRIFDPFFTTKPVGQGSGLGLAVVHEVVEEHEGCIAVESRTGEGSRFMVRLPMMTGENHG